VRLEEHLMNESVPRVVLEDSVCAFGGAFDE
jgi:hypothetical protein